MKKQLGDKQEQLETILKKMDKVIVAFSGGVDSSFLLAFTNKILGENTIAVTVNSPYTPKRELKDAKDFVNSLGIKHMIINIDMKDIESISKNPINRCYICKKIIFSKIKELASKKNISYVLDASNYNDINDYRPGMKALQELSIKSPLVDVRMTKEEIRILSKKMNLNTWNKPSMACLASRFPYGTPITQTNLKMVEKSEDYLQTLGLTQIRVRYHGEIARIEVEKKEFNLIIKNSNKIVKYMKNLGFKYIALDLNGYLTGSLNKDL